MNQIFLEQGTSEWLQFRETKIGASDVSAILGCSPYMSREQLFLVKTKQIPPKPKTANMSYGNEMEDTIRTYAEEVLHDTFTPRVLLHPKHEFLMASLDGMNFEETRILEIKVAKRAVFEEVLNHSLVPSYYSCQVQLQLACSPCSEEAIFFTYWPGPRGNSMTMEEKTAYTIVKPDYELQSKIIEECSAFWDEVIKYNEVHNETISL